jgi:WD40 repeat protein
LRSVIDKNHDAPPALMAPNCSSYSTNEMLTRLPRFAPATSDLLIAVLFTAALSCAQPERQSEPVSPILSEPVSEQPEPSAPEPVAIEEVVEPAPVEAPAPLYPDWVNGPVGEPMNFASSQARESRDDKQQTLNDWKLELALQSGHPGDAYTAKFSPDGRYLATGGGEGSDATVRLWNLSTRKEIRYMPQPYAVSYIEFSPDGSKLRALGGLFETATGIRLHGADSTEAYGDGRVAEWIPTPDWKHIIAIEWDKPNSISTLRVMREDSKETVVIFELPGIRAYRIVPTENATRFAALCRVIESSETEIRIFDWETNQQVALLPCKSPKLVQLSHDGKRLLIAKDKLRFDMIDLEQPDAALWQLESLELMSMALPPGSGFIGDGTRLTVLDSTTNTVLLLDGMTGELVSKFSAPDPISAVGYDASQDRLCASYGPAYPGDRSANNSQPGIRLWSIATGEVLGDLVDDAPRAYGNLDFSADGKFLASAGFRLDPALWDLEEGTRIRRLKGNVVVPDNVAFHPSNRYLSIDRADGDMHVLDLATTRTVATLENCWKSEWDPTGKWLGILPARKARSSDGALLLWNVA